MKESDNFLSQKSKRTKVKSRKSKADHLNTFSAELQDLKRNNLFRTLTTAGLHRDSKITIDGKEYSNFSSNDYLNLSSHPDIIKAASAALNRHGFGSGASRLLSGTREPHSRLEQRIARFKNTESALLFNSGYAANTGMIPVLAGEGDAIFSDELNHASIIDGIRLSRAEAVIYRHRDMDHLEGLLKKNRKRAVKRKLVITDSVFSMDGDIARLQDMAKLCGGYNALLMIDDAHGTGVLGSTGRGGLEHFDIRPGGIIQMGTLSKAAGCFGAFVAGSRDLIDMLINRARSFIYSTALPPAVAAAGSRALAILEGRSAKLRKRLWKNRNRLHQGLLHLGFDTHGSETPIIPIMAGDEKSALLLSRHLFRNHIFAPAIRPPTVPEGACRIRFSVTAGHSDEEIDGLLDCLGRYGR